MARAAVSSNGDDSDEDDDGNGLICAEEDGEDAKFAEYASEGLGDGFETTPWVPPSLAKVNSI